MSRDAARLFGGWLADGKAEGMERGHGDVVEQMIGLASLAPDARVLDVGCGTGWTVRRIAERLGPEGRAAGCDLSAEMIAAARARTADPRCRFEAAAAEALPWPDASFDAIFSMESLYYWPDPEAGLRELARVLRRGGAAWIGLDFHAGNPDSASWPQELGLRLVRRSGEEWAAALRAAGFAAAEHALLLDRRRERRAAHPHGTLLLRAAR